MEKGFGRYKLRGVLGEGGMGRLYVAEQTGIEGFTKFVALKCILPHLADSPHFRGMFLNEARIAARLEHPNIVATYELGEVDGTYFISMEYLPGEDLGAVLALCQATKPMPVDTAAALALQGGNGLEYAHELCDAERRPFELVHRDVNPSNIFVTYYGMVKLLDFGVVKGSTTTKTSPGVFKGKYAYCAPEQISGDAVDRRTDIFCLGIVLWECLTGQRLFNGLNDAQIIDAVRARPIPPPSTLRSGIPEEMDELTLRALARDREQRYQSAGELCEALERFLARRPGRPTSKSIGLWLESLFGAERSHLKKAIAQGNEIDTTLSRLKALGEAKSPGSVISGKAVANVRPRALWSTSLSMPSSAAEPWPAGRAPAPPSAGVPDPVEHDVQTSRYAIVPPGAAPATAEVLSAETSRLDTSALSSLPQVAPAPGPHAASFVARAPSTGGSRALIVVTAVAALAVAAVLVFVLRDGSTSVTTAVVSASAMGALEIKSQPEGAHIFVDGDPSGLKTPAVLRGLRSGRTTEIRLDLDGHESLVHKIGVTSGDQRTYSFRLREVVGKVRLEGLPPRATVYIDDVRVDGGAELKVTIGRHKIRVEADNQAVFSRTMEVHRGEQTIRVLTQGEGR